MDVCSPALSQTVYVGGVMCYMAYQRTPNCFRRYAVYGTGVTISGYTALISSADGVKRGEGP